MIRAKAAALAVPVVAGLCFVAVAGLSGRWRLTADKWTGIIAVCAGAALLGISLRNALQGRAGAPITVVSLAVSVLAIFMGFVYAVPERVALRGLLGPVADLLIFVLAITALFLANRPVVRARRG